VSDQQKLIERLMQALNDAKTCKVLDEQAGDFFAHLLVANIIDLEKRMVDAIVGVKDHPSVSEEMMARANACVSLLGCLARFHDDLLANTAVARKCKKKYDEMVAEGKL